MDDSQALQGLIKLMIDLGALVDSKADLTNLADADLEISDANLIQNSIQIRSQLVSDTPSTEIISATIIDVEILPDRLQNISSDLANNLTSDLINLEPNSTELKTSDSSGEGAIASLQSLLFGSDLQIIKTSVSALDRKVRDIEHNIYDSEELIQLLLPVITDILGIKVSQASTEITRAIAPVIDEMIAINIAEDRVQMSLALAPVMSTAIIENISISPGEFANAIAPEMGMAIKEQLRLNKDVMVDALYPIIGNTIAKYLAEAIKAINEKVEQTFSKEGILRKVRARMQGVSEAELIIRESMPVTIRAIFLIHKASGLIISEVQPETVEILESEMVAGMLTAIRSFVNDCITQSGFDTELSEIDYGGSKIMLEAAGYCYMAVVIDGSLALPSINKIRNTLESIVQTHSKYIEHFNGDPNTVPAEITPKLAQIFTGIKKGTKTELKTANKKINPLFVLVVLIGAIAIPWSIFSYQQHQSQQKLAQIKSQVTRALFSAPELSVYGIAVNVNSDPNSNHQILLQGRVPNSYLKDLAGKIALANSDIKSVGSAGRSGNKLVSINNQIIAVNIPPDPSQTIAEVKRVINLLNKLNGIKISANYDSDKNQVAIAGTVQTSVLRKTVIAAFAQIPRVAIVTSNIQLPPVITTRIYFDFNSTAIAKTEIPKILQIKSIMDLDPDYRLKIIGHSDRLGDLEINNRFALKRAQVVRDLLTQAGVAEMRSQVGAELLPTVGQISQLNSKSSPELERFVKFELSVANLGNLNSLSVK